MFLRDLSLHLLDILQNSITANATQIETTLVADKEKDMLMITLKDNGCGMPPEILAKVTDPFVTSRDTREVGLGISLFKLAAESSGGSFRIDSKINEGTELCATFVISNMDRKPLGDMGDTFSILLASNTGLDFTLSLSNTQNTFFLDTKEIKESLGDESFLSNIEIMRWVNDYINQNVHEIYSGILLEL